MHIGPSTPLNVNVLFYYNFLSRQKHKFRPKFCRSIVSNQLLKYDAFENLKNPTEILKV